MLTCMYLFFPFKSFHIGIPLPFHLLRLRGFFFKADFIESWKVGVERDFKISWFQHPCHGLGHSSLEQIAQKPVPGIRNPQLLFSLVWI